MGKMLHMKHMYDNIAENKENRLSILDTLERAAKCEQCRDNIAAQIIESLVVTQYTIDFSINGQKIVVWFS